MVIMIGDFCEEYLYGKIDLHVHTKASDGTYTINEIVERMPQIDISHIAITDHDTIDGISCDHIDDVEIIPGIEFSTKFKSSRIHLLGYFIDVDNKALKDSLKGIVDRRDARNETIVSMMKNDGINVSYEEMKDRFGSVTGKPHFAQILIENGLVSNVDDAFSLYLNHGKKYSPKKEKPSLEECTNLILGAGGIPVLAHPYEYFYNDFSLFELIDYCIHCKVEGVECRHTSHSLAQAALLERICDDYNLLKTGGSDYHGTSKPDISVAIGKGDLIVPYSWLEALKAKRNQR